MKFKSREEAHAVHRNYDIDTDKEMKYSLDAYNMQKNRLEFLLNNVPECSYLLEVGCNSGGLLRLYSSERKCYCKGIDISPQMVAEAWQKGFNVKIGTAEQLPYKDKEFDVVVATEVLEHIYEPKEAIREIKRVLKDGGILIGTVPHPDSQNSTKKPLEKHQWHNTIFNEEALRTALSEFKDIHCENISWYNDQTNQPQFIGFICKT